MRCTSPHCILLHTLHAAWAGVVAAAKPARALHRYDNVSICNDYCMLIHPPQFGNFQHSVSSNCGNQLTSNDLR